jgi:hypothetical protein
VDVGSFSDVATEVQKEVVTAAAADDIEVSKARPSTEASSKFAKELELSVHTGEDLVQDVPLVKIPEDVPEGQDPSPSVVAFNKSFGTSYHGELLSVGYEVADVKGDASKILTLWKSPTLINEIGEGVSGQSTQLLEQNVRDSGKEPCTSSKKTSVSLDKGSRKKVIVKDLSKKGLLLLPVLFALNFTIVYLWLCIVIFQYLRTFFDCTQHPKSRIAIGIMQQRPL